MVLRLVVLLSIALLVAGQTVVPLATFHGTVHGVSNKLITIETAEGNLVEFEINRKTRILREKKQIRPTDLATGDAVTIEARQEAVRFLIAVTITAQAKAVEPRP
jgi:uncharacterized membrane protein